MDWIDAVLEKYPIKLKSGVLKLVRENLRAEQLKNAVPDTGIADLFMAHFLQEPLAVTSDPVLPDEIRARGAEKEEEDGWMLREVILEVVDVVEIGHSMYNTLRAVNANLNLTLAPADESDESRENNSGKKIPHKMLRFVLSDGRTLVNAAELTPIGSDVCLKMPLGSKMHIKSCEVRRGTLLLDTGCVVFLGGQSPEYRFVNTAPHLRLHVTLSKALGLEPREFIPREKD